MDKAIVDFLMKQKRSKIVEPGEIIFSQGDVATEFYYLVDGLSLTYTIFEDGRERNILVSWPDQIFGASTVFEGVPRRASAIAVKRCQVIVIDRPVFQLCCARFPNFWEVVVKEISRDVGVLFEELADSSLMTAELRVARFLCRRMARGQHEGPDDMPELRYTQSFVASVLGISRVSVGQAVSSLVQKGWMETTYGGLVILDVHALREFAYGGEML